VLANSKLVIFWGCDPAWKNYSTLRQNLMFQQWKAAGIKMIVVDSFVHNDTAALYADQFIAPIPGTDEAMLAAIANVWITNGTYNQSFVSTHVYGFQQFSDYITGKSDGTPKTPQWAAGICGVDATTITNLANTWASNVTFFYGEYPEGAQRRDFACQHARMEIALIAMQGLGMPGRGYGGTFSVGTTVTATGMGRFGSVPSVSNPVAQYIRHNNLAQAILTGSATWTTAERHPYKVEQESYPLAGSSKIHLIAWASGSGANGGINQRQNINPKIQALQDPSIEFTFSNNAWWESTAKFSDVIFPVATVGEVNDMTTWQEYVIYQHSLMAPVGEAKCDFDIYTGIAQKLGFDQQLTQGMTSDQWLQQIYAAAKMSLSYTDFQTTGYVKYPVDTTPKVTTTWANFYADPVKNPLPTKSGLLEVYSQAIAAYFGDNTVNAPPIPKYIPGPENLLNASTYAGGKYPLLLSSAHAKFARHSQWQNLTWLRDEPQMYTNGYKTMLINTADAATYGLSKGDVVRVFNDRGQLLAGAFPTDEQAPKTIWVSEGGWYTPQQPGVVNSIDLGGNVEVLIDSRQPEPLCDGMINSALVQIEKWNGGV
nr:molybdopterin-dependent oxidoreductase [Nitrososphaerota archaeon]